MPTREEWAKKPLAERLERMSRTADELSAAIRGQSAGVLSRRPDDKNWAAVEVICHLRDVEEVFLIRLQSILVNDDLKIYASPAPVDRWPQDRQYLRNDAADAIAAFRRNRNETIAFMNERTAADVAKPCTHPSMGRMTMDDFIAILAWHDDNHLDQLKRAVESRA